MNDRFRNAVAKGVSVSLFGFVCVVKYVLRILKDLSRCWFTDFLYDNDGRSTKRFSKPTNATLKWSAQTFKAFKEAI